MPTTTLEQSTDQSIAFVNETGHEALSRRSQHPCSAGRGSIGLGRVAWRRAHVAQGELVRRLLARRSLDPEHARAYEDYVARSGWLVNDADADALAEAGVLAEQKLETHGVLVLRTYFRWTLRSGREDEARATLERFVAARPQVARSARRTLDHELRRSRNA